MKTNKANPLTDGPPITVRPRESSVVPASGSALEWTQKTLSGVEMWIADPKPAVRYIIVRAGRYWSSNLTTGTSHKFCRAIADETDDLEAAKSACWFHWLNDQAGRPI